MDCISLGRSLGRSSANFNDIKATSSAQMMSKEMGACSLLEKADQCRFPTLLELPELALDNILERLSPADLWNLACVCWSLREICQNDQLWEIHMNRKWGRVIGKKARSEWLLFAEAISNPSFQLGDAGKHSIEEYNLAPCAWNLSWIKTAMKDGKVSRISSSFASYMNWFLLLESGHFWFSAQVHNTQTCKDIILRYDRLTDTFRSRFPSNYERHGPYLEETIKWEILRASPTDNLPHHPHVSDCLDDLRPGDHVEIQWRPSNNISPYGWWYAVVGHLLSCDGNEHQCRCSYSDLVAIEFKQYPVPSRWSKVIMPKKDQDRIENAHSTGGFYGGIRKLYNEDEISMWTTWYSRGKIKVRYLDGNP